MTLRIQWKALRGNDNLKIAAQLGIAGFVVVFTLLANLQLPVTWWWIPLLAGSWIAASALMYRRFNQLERRYLDLLGDPADRLRRRVKAVNLAFTEATTLADELQRELSAQQVALDDVVTQAEEHRAVLALNPEHAQLVGQYLTRAASDSQRADRRRSWTQFGLGVLVSAVISFPIGLWVNQLSQPQTPTPAPAATRPAKSAPPPSHPASPAPSASPAPPSTTPTR
ncbi:hypothetical protein ACIBG8_07305 [Nonomuraea sp. NPDC050556]|uniref:hypothetical protein n=1 Tax=Nonomuraea sp. NPDC050556 TaxID=3364369 RepID=UPI003788AB75